MPARLYTAPAIQGRTQGFAPTTTPALLQDPVNFSKDLLIRKMLDFCRPAGTMSCTAAATLAHRLVDFADTLILIKFNGPVCAQSDTGLAADTDIRVNLGLS